MNATDVLAIEVAELGTIFAMLSVESRARVLALAKQLRRPAPPWNPNGERVKRASEHFQRTGVLPAWAPRAGRPALPAGWRVIEGRRPT